MNRKIVFTGVRKEILDELLKDKTWSSRLARAKTQEEITDVIEAFCKERGYTIREVDFDDK